MIFQRYISCGKIVFYCKLIATIKWKKKTDPDDRFTKGRKSYSRRKCTLKSYDRFRD